MELLETVNWNMRFITRQGYSWPIKNKHITLVEYIPDEKKKNIEIYISSNNDFYFAAYGGLSKDNYIYYSKYK